MEAGADDQAPSLSGCPVTEVDTKGMCKKGEDEEANEEAEEQEEENKGGFHFFFFTILYFC